MRQRAARIRMGGICHARAIGRNRERVCPALGGFFLKVVHRARRSSSHANVVFLIPIRRVVPALSARFCEIGHLILQKSVLLEQIPPDEPHAVRLFVRKSDASVLNALPERRVFFDRERIERHMVDARVCF